MATLSNHVTWTPVHYERPKWIKPVATAIAIGSLLMSVSVALKSNTVRSALPSSAQGLLLKVEETLGGFATASDAVVMTKQIKGKKLLRKTAGLEHHTGGLVSYQYQKKFRLDDSLSAIVTVDKFATKSEAMAAAKKRGGNKADQLSLGRPSFMEIHGLDKRNNYFIKGVTRDGENLVTVTLIRKLTPEQQVQATSDAYESMMGAYYEQHFEQVQKIASVQVKRLGRQ